MPLFARKTISGNAEKALFTCKTISGNAEKTLFARKTISGNAEKALHASNGNLKLGASPLRGRSNLKNNIF